MVTSQTTPPADIPPSGDQRRPTPEHQAVLGPQFESGLQCCQDLGDYGDHPTHGTRWLPHAFLAQQGAEAANRVVIEKLAGVPGGNLPLVTMMEHGMPKVKLHHR
jgi:hypothetical protein